MKKFLISLCLVLGVAMPAFASTDMIPLDKAPNKLNDLTALQNGAKIAKSARNRICFGH
jgi:ubiquinol-cytochrome c reductase cytochrome c1 subunit